MKGKAFLKAFLLFLGALWLAGSAYGIITFPKTEVGAKQYREVKKLAKVCKNKTLRSRITEAYRDGKITNFEYIDIVTLARKDCVCSKILDFM